MENNRISVRINLEKREFEVRGDAKYIEQRFGQYIDEYIGIIKDQQREEPTRGQQAKETATSSDAVTEAPASQIPETFGEYLNKFPKGISNVDKLLIASYFVQSHSKDKSFTVMEASNLLLEQGIKLSNASAFNNSSLSSKRVFKVTGKNFRVSESGVEHIKNL